MIHLNEDQINSFGRGVAKAGGALVVKYGVTTDSNWLIACGVVAGVWGFLSSLIHHATPEPTPPPTPVVVVPSPVPVVSQQTETVSSTTTVGPARDSKVTSEQTGAK